MMDMVTVRLVFYGLMAFVPNDSSPTSINALLLDTQGHHYASDGCKLPRHIPALYVKAAACSEIKGANKKPCSLSPEVFQVAKPDSASGSWLLNGESLSLEIETPDGKREKRELVARRSQGVRSSLPSTSEEAQDLAWLPTLPAPADRNCIGPADDCPIAARFEINEGEVTTCQLFYDSDEKVTAFELKPLGASPAATSTTPQALTGAVLTSLSVPRGSKVRIASQTFTGAWRNRDRPRRVIELEAGDRPRIDVWLTNLPISHDATGPDHTCHDGAIDRHYEMYYNLLAWRIPFAERKVPHIVPASARGEGKQPAGDKSCQPVPLKDRRLPGNWLACGSVWVNSNES